MAARRITRKEMKRDEFVTAMGRITLWMEEHAREALILAGFVVVAAIGSVLVYQFLAQREEKASDLLARGVDILHAPVRGADPASAQGTSGYATSDEKYRAALDQMEALIQTYPRSRSGRLGLYYRGVALMGLHRPQEAAKALEAFLDSSPGSFAAPMARAALAHAYEEAGDPAKALDLFERLSRSGEGGYPPQAALMEMGLCLEKMGKKDDAKKIYERIGREFPDS